MEGLDSGWAYLMEGLKALSNESPASLGTPRRLLDESPSSWMVLSQDRSYLIEGLKEIVSRDFRPLFFHESNRSTPLIQNLKPFQIQLQFRRDV
jgi:hypothetical protein